MPEQKTMQAYVLHGAEDVRLEEAARPGLGLGEVLVLVGILPDGTEIPANTLLTRELQYISSWLFANVFERVIELVVSGRIDARPLITRSCPFAQFPEVIVEASRADISTCNLKGHHNQLVSESINHGL